MTDADDNAQEVMRDFRIRIRQIQLEIERPLTEQERQILLFGYVLGARDNWTGRSDVPKGTDMSIKEMIEKGHIDKDTINRYFLAPK